MSTRFWSQEEKQIRPLYQLRCVGKGDDSRTSALERSSLRHGQIFSYVPALPFDELSWRERPSMVFAFNAFALGDLGWVDDLYYGAIQLCAALTVCHFLSESLALRLLTLKTQGSAFLDSFCT